MRLPVFGKLLLGVSVSIVILFGVLGANYLNRMAKPSPNTPQAAAEQFVSDLAAHQYHVAVGSLSRNLSHEVSVKDLESLAMVIDAHQMGIRSATSSDLQTIDGQLAVRVTVEFNSGVKRFLDLPVLNENGVWKVASIDPLWRVSLNYPKVHVLNG